MKFGGTSVADAQRIKHAARRIVETRERGNRVVAVLSARGTTTDERLKVLALGLAWGGAAGNLIDRVRSKPGVVDFIDIGVGNVRFWTFNVADSAVTIGAVLLGWVLLQEDRRQQRQRASE